MCNDLTPDEYFFSVLATNNLKFPTTYLTRLDLDDLVLIKLVYVMYE